MEQTRGKTPVQRFHNFSKHFYCIIFKILKVMLLSRSIFSMSGFSNGYFVKVILARQQVNNQKEQKSP